MERGLFAPKNKTAGGDPVKVRFECRARGMVALASATTLLAACHAAPDLSGVASESAKPVQRYDTTQALASNGKVVPTKEFNAATRDALLTLPDFVVA